MVGGNVDNIRRRDLYSAARPSRRNGFITIWPYHAARIHSAAAETLVGILKRVIVRPAVCKRFLDFFTLTFRALGAHCHDLGHDSRMTSCLKQSVHNCTVNFSDVGTSHGSRTVSLR